MLGPDSTGPGTLKADCQHQERFEALSLRFYQGDDREKMNLCLQDVSVSDLALPVRRDFLMSNQPSRFRSEKIVVDPAWLGSPHRSSGYRNLPISTFIVLLEG